MEPLFWDTSIQGIPLLRGHKVWSRKNVHIIFVSVTSFGGTPLLKGKGDNFWVLKSGFNLHSREILALKKWLTTKNVEKLKCTLVNITTAFTTWTVEVQGGSGYHPHKVLLSFFLEDKTSVPVVFSSCSFISRTHFETSLVMFSYYGYKIWRHKKRVVKPILGENTCFFNFLQQYIKVNLVAKTMQSAYLCVIFHVKYKKLPFLAVLTWFLILGKIQDGEGFPISLFLYSVFKQICCIIKVKNH